MRVHRDSMAPLFYWFPRVGLCLGGGYLVWGGRFWWLFKNEDAGQT